jgi:stress-induced morphogen
MIATADLESAIRTAIPVSHLEIIDQSNGCGENYAILVVSEVRRGLFFIRRGANVCHARLLKEKRLLQDIVTVIHSLLLNA